VIYTVEILRSAQKQLAKIHREDRLPIIEAIRALAGDPRPRGSKKLSGRPAWRVRVGRYRIIYEIHDKRLVLLVVTVGHRRDVYR
jgi:mRNA interferase RelE/StbE